MLRVFLVEKRAGSDQKQPRKWGPTMTIAVKSLVKGATGLLLTLVLLGSGGIARAAALATHVEAMADPMMKMLTVLAFLLASAGLALRLRQQRAD